jgi:hypothetical protein
MTRFEKLADNFLTWLTWLIALVWTTIAFVIGAGLLFTFLLLISGRMPL